MTSFVVRIVTETVSIIGYRSKRCDRRMMVGNSLSSPRMMRAGSAAVLQSETNVCCSVLIRKDDRDLSSYLPLTMDNRASIFSMDYGNAI